MRIADSTFPVERNRDGGDDFTIEDREIEGCDARNRRNSLSLHGLDHPQPPTFSLKSSKFSLKPIGIAPFPIGIALFPIGIAAIPIGGSLIPIHFASKPIGIRSK